jgi:hypothetical protein
MNENARPNVITAVWQDCEFCRIHVYLQEILSLTGRLVYEVATLQAAKRCAIF